MVNTIEYGVLKTHKHCTKILSICQRLVFGVQDLEDELRDHCSLKRQLLRKIIKILWLNSLFCRKIAGFDKLGRMPIKRTEHLSYTYTPSVMALRGVRFWHHHPQTSCYLTPFCGNFLKKESTATTQESWKILMIIPNSLLLALTKKFFERWQEALRKWRMFAFEKVWNVFSISYNYSNLFIILITTFWIFLKIKNTKIWMVESTGLIFVRDVLHNIGSYTTESNKLTTTVKSKTIPLQDWTGPKGSRRLRLPHFKTAGTWRW